MLGDQIINGLAFGAIYILVAVPLFLQFGILRIVNLAFGEIFALASFGSIWLVGSWSASVPIGLAGATVSALVIGSAVQRFVVMPLGNVSDPHSPAHLNCLVATMGCAIVVQNSLIAVFGANPLPFPTSSDQGIALGRHPLFILLSSAMFCVALVWVLLNYTPLGIQLRALVEDRELAVASGVNVRKVQWFAVGLSYVLCGVSSYVVAGYLSFTSAYAGAGYGLKAIIILVVAGNKGLLRLCIVALGLGIVEALAIGYGSSPFRDAFAYTVLFVLIQARTIKTFGRLVRI